MDHLIELANELFRAGWTIEMVRRELRGTILSCGDYPTCSSVEEAIGISLTQGKIK